MGVDIAWLRSRFDDVSKRHPGLSLVSVLRDDTLETGLKKSVFRKKSPTHPFPAMLGTNEKYECLNYFPYWNFWNTPNSPWDNHIWAMWLHRDSYFQSSDNLACLNEYSMLLRIIMQFADDLCKRKGFHPWTSNVSFHVECDNGSRFCGSASWLLLLSTLAGRQGPSSQIRHSSRCPLSPIRMITRTFPTGHTVSSVDPAITSHVLVIPDVGVESVLYLDSLDVMPGSNPEQATGLCNVVHESQQAASVKAKRDRSWFGPALAELKKDRDLRDAEIARKIGVAKSTISRDPEFQTIRRTLKQQAFDVIPKGSKNDGSVDAFDE